jgi:hypothetical protein
MHAFPKPKWTYHRRPQLIIVVPPQDLEVSIVEERARVRCALPRMNTAAPELHSEVGENAFRLRRILDAHENVIKCERHSASLPS